MKAVLSGRKLFLAVLTAASLLGVGTLAVVNPEVLAGPPKPDYSLSIPAQTIVQPDTSATYTATMVQGNGGYTHPVVLSAKDLPKGVSVAFDLDGNGQPSVSPDSPENFVVTIPSTMKVSTYTFTIHSAYVSSGKEQDAHDTKVTLGVAASSSPAPSFSLTLTPSAQTAVVGSASPATYKVQAVGTVPSGGIALTAKGLPPGTSAAFDPPPGSISNTQTPSTLNVAVSNKAKPGSYHFTVTGTSGKTHYDVLAQLTIQAPAGASSFSLGVSPTNQQVAAGASAAYTVGIARNNFPGAVALSTSGLPSDIQASFSPSTADPGNASDPSAGTASTLTLTTDEVTTPDGTFNFMIVGTSGPTTSSVKATLVVNTPPGKAFGIQGDVSSAHLLYPGSDSQSINLTLANPNDKPILITSLVVTVTGTSNPASTGHRGCLASDFDVTQYGGGYPLRLDKRVTQTLSTLGVPSGQWPTIRMKDLSENQDDCKGVTVNLSYAGNAREAT